MAEGFCTICGIDIESFENLTQCPNCGTISIPCSYAKQVNVSINIHELRLLCIWAERWAGQTDADQNVVYAIATRLRKQLTSKECLTLADEFTALKDAGINYSTNMPEGDLP